MSMLSVKFSSLLLYFAGEDNLLDMATVYPPNESTGKENHAEAPIHELKDERAWTKRTFLPKPACKCSRYGRRFSGPTSKQLGPSAHSEWGWKRRGVSGGRDAPLPPLPKHTKRTAKHSTGATFYYAPNAGRRRKSGSNIRLEVCRNGRRPHMPFWLYFVYHPFNVRNHISGAASSRVIFPQVAIFSWEWLQETN